jgi:gliding motility-associated-like protein
MKKILLLICVLSCFCCLQTNAQDFSNKGKDFWVGYGYHVSMANSNSAQNMVLYFTSDVNATVTVEIPLLNYSQTYAVTANQITSTSPLPKSGATDARLINEGLSNAGIHITSDNPVVAYAHIYNSSVSAASLLFPTNTLGKDYYTLGFTQVSNENNSNAFCFVIATEDNTTVEITPSAQTLTHAANVPFTITLQKGQVYNLKGSLTGNSNGNFLGVDLTGTRIRSISVGGGSCKRIAVFSGSGKINIKCINTGNNSADNIFQQSFPSSAWGKKYLTAPTEGMRNNYYRVMIKDAGTVVKVNGVVQTGLLNGRYYEFSSSQPNLIEADNPVLVAQYVTTANQCNNTALGSLSDPEMIYLSPVEQTISKITLNSTNFFNITQHYINVVIPKNGVSSFKLDGIAYAGFQQHPANADYMYALISVTSGAHNLVADTGFNAIAYGYGNAESYGYNAGTNVIDLYQFVTIKNNNASVNLPVTCKGSSFQLGLTLPYPATSIEWKFNSNPSITPNADVVTTNVADSSYIKDNKTLYVYRLPGSYQTTAAGSFPIKAIVTSPSADGCSGLQEISYDLISYEQPVADFKSITKICAGGSIGFYDSSNGFSRPIVQWGWNMGNNDSLQGKNVVQQYVNAGTYNITHTVMNDIGCSASVTKPITITPRPVANFTLSVDPKCTGKEISFTNTSTISSGNIAVWKWDTGLKTDSLTTPQTEKETYTQAGTYPVKLQVISDEGCFSDVKIIDVQVHPNPVAHFLLPDVCLNDAFANFTDSSYFKETTTATLSYAWTFGDASSGSQNNSALQNPKHKYTATGNYPVALTIMSSDGCTDQKQRNLTVNGATPHADFSFVKTTKICSNEQVQIKNISTVDFGEITRIEIIWDTNDPSAVATVDEFPTFNKIYSHTYPTFNSPASKTYSIRMRSFSGASCLNDVTKTVTVYSMPKLSFSLMKGICLNANSTTITNASETSSNAGSFTYTGIGITNTTGTFDPAVAGSGVHTLTYTYTTTNGCIDSVKKDIRVFVLPVASFSVQQPNCDKNAVVFIDASSSVDGPIKQWQWNFGDNKTLDTTVKTASHLYSLPASYNASLKVVSDSGCTSIASTKTVTVTPLPVVDFDLPGNVCLPSGKATFTNKTTISDGTQSSLSYLWNFGDVSNNVSAMKDPVHNYSSTGTKTIKLVVTTNNGCVDSATKTFSTIYAQPHSTITSSKILACVNETINFSGSVQNANGNVTSYHWTANNNNFSTQNISTSFASAGMYTVNYYFTDEKGCASDTSTVTMDINSYPIVNSMPTLYVLEGGSVKLQPEITGTIIDLQWTPSLYLDSTKSAFPTSTPLKTITYQLQVTGKGDCVVTKDVIVQVLGAPLVPNAFSPNGDGINDTWGIQHLSSYPDCTVEVFDRYGALLYYSKGYKKNWDGTFNGKPLLSGTYYYIIDPKRGRAKQSGAVTIIK